MCSYKNDNLQELIYAYEYVVCAVVNMCVMVLHRRDGDLQSPFSHVGTSRVVPTHFGFIA